MYFLLSFTFTSLLKIQFFKQQHLSTVQYISWISMCRTGVSEFCCCCFLVCVCVCVCVCVRERERMNECVHVCVAGGGGAND